MNKKLIFIIIGVVVLLAIVAVVLVVVLGGKNKPVEITFDEFYFDEAYSNLQPDDSGKTSIVKYVVCVKYSGGEDTLALLTKNKTELKNNIDQIMRSTKREDLDKPNGKEKLRSRIQNEIIDVLELDDTVIADVFLQPFVIQ